MLRHWWRGADNGLNVNFFVILSFQGCKGLFLSGTLAFSPCFGSHVLVFFFFLGLAGLSAPKTEYLGPPLCRRFDSDFANRINTWWANWRQVSGVTVM